MVMDKIVSKSSYEILTRLFQGHNVDLFIGLGHYLKRKVI